MEQIPEIFLATDFKPHSHHAEKKAAEMAQKLGVPLSIIHVFHPEAIAPGPYYDLLNEQKGWAQEIIAENRVRAQKLLDDLFVQLKADGHKYLLEGDPKEEIVAFAAKHKVRYLIVGMKKNKPAVISSVSHYIAQNAPCSVLLVP